MNILWAGGEDIDFPNGVAPNVANDGFSAGYARCSLNPSVGGAAFSNVFPAGAITACWLHFTAMQTQNQNGTEAGFVGFGKSGVSKALMVTAYATASAQSSMLRISKWTGSSWTNLNSSPTGVLVLSAVNRIDVQLVAFADTVNGTINVYVNEGTVPVVTYTGDLTQTSFATNVDRLVIGPGPGTGIDHQKNRVSEIIVADSDTRGLRLVTAAPNGAGSANNWTGAYTTIDETTNSDADNIYADADAEDFQCALIDLPAGTFGCAGIAISARALVTESSAVSKIKLGVLDAAVVDVDAGQTCTAGWVTYGRIAKTINGTALDPTRLNALQLNLRAAT